MSVERVELKPEEPTPFNNTLGTMFLYRGEVLTLPEDGTDYESGYRTYKQLWKMGELLVEEIVHEVPSGCYASGPTEYDRTNYSIWRVPERLSDGEREILEQIPSVSREQQEWFTRHMIGRGIRFM